MLNRKLLNTISDTLVVRNETLAVAESVTSGLIMNYLSLAQNTTQFFQGGIVAYNLGQKARHFAIEPIWAENSNCVSEEVAQRMAKEVSLSFSSQWGIAITGYAAPVPALKIKSSFAIYAFVFRGEIVSTTSLQTSRKGTLNVQRYYAESVLKHLARVVGG